jgi:GTP cyclohydrolase I
MLQVAFREIMDHGLGLDLDDDSLRETPKRVAKMFSEEVFYGLDYSNFPACTVIDNKMGYDEAIAGTKIDVLSMCEHHFVPFIGHAYVAYIPGTKVLGLSKFNRVVDFFARRPQVQERLTEQCHAAFTTILETDDVAVVIRCQHLCVRLRGVKQDGGSTVTSKLGGRFKSVDALRSEFFALATLE